MTSVHIEDIIMTFNDLFNFEENGNILIKQNVSGTMIYWEDPLRNMYDEFQKELLDALKRNYNIDIITDDDDGLVFSFYNSEIKMTVDSDFHGTESWFGFEIECYDYDTETENTYGED